MHSTMKEITLNESRVVFTSDPHSYHLGDRELKGVTGILSKHIFTNKYFNVSQETLDRAADRGSRVHEQCRAYDKVGFIASEEVQAYSDIKESLGLTTLANEYVVSDNENVASCVDLVAVRDGDKIVLADFKTTSHLDVEYLSWQLSIYKYLFEMQNPHLKVSELVGIWLPLSRYGKPRAELIREKSMDEVKRLLEADANGEIYSPTEIAQIPPQVVAMQERAYSILSRIAELTEEKETLTKALYEAMTAYDVKSWDMEKVSISRTLPTTRKSFDSKRFKEENPDLYAKYLKTSEVDGSVRITLRKDKK